MRNVKFKDKETKEFYQSLIKHHQGLGCVILKVMKNKDFKVEDIAGDIYNIDIVLLDNDKKIDIIIDLLNNKYIVNTNDKDYCEIYDNYARKDITPVGYLYSKKDRKIVKNNFNSIDTDKKTYYYDLIDGKNFYNILIEDNNNNNFDEKVFINKLLHSRTKYMNLCCLLLMILNNFKLNNVTVKITDTKRGIAIIDKGLLTNYTEYREDENDYQKIYLENNEIMIERHVKEVYQSDLNAYVKKIGDNDGKEKG